MGKLFLIIILSVLTPNRQNTASIEGKWKVDKVDLSAMTQKMTPQQMTEIDKFLIKPLTNAVIEFKSDHHFSLTPSLKNMPQNNSWEYDAVNKLITVKTINDSKSMIMKIFVANKDGITYFKLSESPVVLKVHKL